MRKSLIITLFLISNTIILCQVQEQRTTRIPLKHVQVKPIFPGCESSGNQYCTRDEIRKHLNTKFNKSITESLGLNERVSVKTQFTINKFGQVTDISINHPNKEIQEEAIRVVNSLPRMTSGYHNNSKVDVLCSFSIVLNQDEKLIPFAKVDVPPFFLELNEDEKSFLKKSFNNKLSFFLRNNFNTQIIQDLGITDSVRAIIIFVITREGEIDKLKMRTPHEKIEEEIRRVFSILPPITRPFHNGENVDVPYSLPFTIG